MESDTSVARGVRAMGDDFDVSCKRLLAEKPILSRMLKACLAEYSSESLEVIEGRWLASSPRVGSDPLHRDDTTSNAVTKLTGEDKTHSEGMTTFDIRFDALAPCASEPIRIEIDVEAQKEFNPGYPLTKRGVYYAGRMLSMQGTTDVVNSHYERVRKVVSMWVCANVPQAFAGTVTRFHLTQKDLLGSAPYRKQNYDLVDVVMICLDTKMRDASYGILGLLGMLLLPGMSAQDKLSSLEEDFGMMVSNRLEGKVKEMCNLSELYWDEAMDKGFKEGEEKGRAEGILATVRSILKSTSYTAEQVLAMLDISTEERQSLLGQL